jgi:hypothetical protein
MAPNTRLGAIEGIKTERGRADYHFRQDQRFREEGPLFEAWFFEDELDADLDPRTSIGPLSVRRLSDGKNNK